MPEAAPTSAASAAPATAGWRLEHSYAQLPPLLHVAVAPTPVRAPRLVILNRALAENLGLAPDGLESEHGAAIFAGNALPPGALPIAQAYAGHQYGHFTTLGDGRAILLGEQITPAGERFDVQLKGAGATPYSRRGDGRAALGPMLREYIISEAMHALRIPTTRSLAVTATGEEVWRQSALPGAVLTRVAASHIRVGTFEWAAARGDNDALRALVDYTVHRHYPELEPAENRASALLERVIARQAALIAQWMLVGFVHGVMNTDNMAVSGETIDYGPCAFMDAYNPATAFSSIDAHGRYAYRNQPPIAQWNLARFAEALLPLIAPEENRAVEIATSLLGNFVKEYHGHWLAGMRRKLGLLTEEAGDSELAEALLASMQKAGRDFTNTFLALTREDASDELGSTDEEFRRWLEQWRARTGRQPHSREESRGVQRAHNPAFIPRNHLVESALAAAEQNDLSVMEGLLGVLAAPFDHARRAPEYCRPDPEGGEGYRTFCGT